MGSTGQRYTQEFKDSAIQLALNSEKSALQIAKDLGMSDKTLYAWLKEYRKKNNLQTNISAHNKSGSSKESLEEENRRLRKELAKVKQEREILKKATAYFAKEAQ
jgi:transposase